MELHRAVQEDVLGTDGGADLQCQVVLVIILQGSAGEVWLLGEGAHLVSEVLEEGGTVDWNAFSYFIVTFVMVELCHQIYDTILIILNLS